MRDLYRFALLPGDTIVAMGRNRISFFDAAGKFITALTPSSPPSRLPPGPKEVIAVLGTNAYAAAAIDNPASRTRGDRWIEAMPMAVLSAKNEIIGDLGKQPAFETAMDDRPRPVWLGAVLAAATDTRMLYIGIGDEYSIRGYAPTGELRTIIRRNWAPHRITPAEIDMYVQEWGKRWIKSTGAQADAERRDLRDDPYAERLPAFSQFLVATDGRLWVREPNVIDAAWAGALNDMPLAPSRWSVFDPQGRWLTVVTMPARFHPTHIGRDYVLGESRDDDDVEIVVRYRLRTP